MSKIGHIQRRLLDFLGSQIAPVPAWVAIRACATVTTRKDGSQFRRKGDLEQCRLSLLGLIHHQPGRPPLVRKVNSFGPRDGLWDPSSTEVTLTALGYKIARYES